MGRSSDSYNKKEREKKKQKKKKDKAERREMRKQHGKTEEFMYLDADGNLVATPPDPAKKNEVSLEEIQISVPKQEKSDESAFLRSGTVEFFNTEKGYGFIKDNSSRDSFYVHATALNGEIKDRDQVTFEVGKGPRGPVAVNVSLA